MKFWPDRPTEPFSPVGSFVRYLLHSSSDGFLEDPWKPLERSQISSQILRKSCCPKLSKIWLYDLYALFRMSGLGRIWDEFGRIWTNWLSSFSNLLSICLHLQDLAEELGSWSGAVGSWGRHPGRPHLLSPLGVFHEIHYDILSHILSHI